MLKVEVTCGLDEREKLEETLKKWGVPFYTEEVKANGKSALKVTAFAPDFVINDLVDELVKVVDMRKGHASIIWSQVSGRSVRYSSAVRSLERFRGRWSIADIEGLIESANSQARVDPIQLTLGAVASMVALFGLIGNNIVMIISAMLLSPILGPLYGFSLNVVMGRGRDALTAVSSILKLLTVIFTSALLVSLLLRLFDLMPAEPTREILIRGDSGVVYILLAVLLGYAGVVAIVSRIPEILAGVSIAAALVPPTTVVGISLAMGWWGIFFGSLRLTVENVLGLLIGSLLGLYILNVSPRSYYEKRSAKLYTRRTVAVLGIMLLFLVLLEIIK
ncbi:TIGR00341 family protein [Thermococcus sp. 21S9]|uniref:TIGR00341 family protein n=1 Tax=Thermococcus sp. 21S9 TaxID=1638223 RepID=UPI0014396CD7|nr:TIGR00341 family protein [Thermococcus sp. 21S9]